MSVVHCEIAEGIARLRLDDGRANAINDALLDAFERALEEAAGAGALVLIGREGRFSGGLDLKILPTLPQEELIRVLRRFGAMVGRLLAFPRPVVAACTGHAIAGGAVVLMCCDHRIGAQGDFKIGLTEVAVGIPMPRFVLDLARITLPAQSWVPAILHGRAFGPEEARRIGFLDETCPPGELEERAMETARALARLPEPAYSITKRRMRGDLMESAADGLAHDLETFFTSAAREHAAKFA